MSRYKSYMLAIVLFWLWPVLAEAQSLPLLNMGYSGAGIGSDLLKVIERAGFDTPAMLNLAVAGSNLKVVAVPINRIEPMFVVRINIKVPADLKGK